MSRLAFPSRRGIKVLGVLLDVVAKDGLHWPKRLPLRVQFDVFLHATAPNDLSLWLRLWSFPGISIVSLKVPCAWVLRVSSATQTTIENFTKPWLWLHDLANNRGTSQHIHCAPHSNSSKLHNTGVDDRREISKAYPRKYGLLYPGKYNGCPKASETPASGARSFNWCSP